MEFKIKSLEEWHPVVDYVKNHLERPILLLKGNLGAGKTTFTQQLVAALGSPDEVNSPTYSIVNEYASPQGTIFHFDLYRLKTIEEAYDFGIEDYLDNAFLCIIEWPEIYENELLSSEFHNMQIINNEEIRTIYFD